MPTVVANETEDSLTGWRTSVRVGTRQECHVGGRGRRPGLPVAEVVRILAISLSMPSRRRRYELADPESRGIHATSPARPEAIT